MRTAALRRSKRARTRPRPGTSTSCLRYPSTKKRSRQNTSASPTSSVRVTPRFSSESVSRYDELLRAAPRRGGRRGPGSRVAPATCRARGGLPPCAGRLSISVPSRSKTTTGAPSRAAFARATMRSRSDSVVGAKRDTLTWEPALQQSRGRIKSATVGGPR